MPVRAVTRGRTSSRSRPRLRCCRRRMPRRPRALRCRTRGRRTTRYSRRPSSDPRPSCSRSTWSWIPPCGPCPARRCSSWPGVRWSRWCPARMRALCERRVAGDRRFARASFAVFPVR
jgi:hypothetical protein